ncbi:MAG: hypothetical protein WC729_30035 [Sphingomonas sp.]|uniref:hypothetical protein n=1 Tax=Sphingomonas sp. TaxID=28214 RepID=UPI003564630B
MSGMYAQRQGLGDLGWSISDLPLISNALSFADSKVKDAVEYITKKYAEYVQVQQQAPAMLEDAEKFVAVLNQTGTAEQQMQAARYLAAARAAKQGADNSGPVDQVMSWLNSAKQSLGLGVIVVPLWIAGAVIIALGIVKMTVSSWSEGRTIRAALTAGLSPEQIAKLGVGRSPFGSALFGATSAVTLLVVLGVGLFAYNALRPGGRR